MRFKPKGVAVLISALSLLMLFSAFSVWGCTGTEPAEPGEKDEAGTGGGETQEETITLTLYFRNNVEAREWLSPEKRTVAGTSDPYRAAMEQLIEGPTPGTQLYAVLPDTVEVLDIEVTDGVCMVNVSVEILSDANQVGVSASGEGLALAAIANTLTEFEGIDRVKLLIEGLQSGMIEGRFVEDFWGHMGLPEYLERDESVIYLQAGQ